MPNERVKSLSELRDKVLDSLVKVETDTRYCAQAHEIGNLAGKVVQMCVLHLKRSEMNKEKSDGTWDEFISGNSGQKALPPAKKGS